MKNEKFMRHENIGLWLWPHLKPQIRHRCLVPTFMYLHSNSTQILALKKTGFFTFSDSKKNFKKKFIRLLCNFSVRTLRCFQKKFRFFFDLEKVKKRASKVAHNRPRPFFPTVQPRPQPTAHSPKLIFHIMKSRDQISVLLSVN